MLECRQNPPYSRNGMKVIARIATSHGSACHQTMAAHGGTPLSKRRWNATRFATTTTVSWKAMMIARRKRRTRAGMRTPSSTMCGGPPRHRAARGDAQQDVDHTALLVDAERRTARQAESRVEQPLGDGAAAHRPFAMHRLQVHRLPHRSRFDVLGVEREAHVLRRRAEEH